MPSQDYETLQKILQTLIETILSDDGNFEGNQMILSQFDPPLLCRNSTMEIQNGVSIFGTLIEKGLSQKWLYSSFKIVHHLCNPIHNGRKPILPTLGLLTVPYDN